MIDQLIAHGVGDYVLQSHWMASEKTKLTVAALVHVGVYTLCFVPLTTSAAALLAIGASHFVIDRWRLARYVGWLKNHLAPRSGWPPPWAECSATGYSADTPPWLAVWLMIIVDQVMHIACNALALRYL